MEGEVTVPTLITRWSMFTCWSQGAACAQDLGENAGAKSGLGVLPMFYTSLRAGGGLREVGRVNGGRGAGGGGGKATLRHRIPSAHGLSSTRQE